MSKKEPPLMQELGRKKYFEKVEKANKHYDNYKAGKRDPKTGEYYNPISFTNPTKQKFSGVLAIGSIVCEKCLAEYPINRRTFCIICSNCKNLIKVTDGYKNKLLN